MAGLVMLGGNACATDLSIAPPHPFLTATGSGFAVDLDGSVLTARHAVEGCGSLFILKDKRIAPAQVVALDDDADLAVVRSPVKAYLAATFPEHDALESNEPIFAAGYDVLIHMKDRASLMYDGVALDRKTPSGQLDFSLLSNADHGASGSPVLDRRGRVVGLVTRRVLDSVDAGRTVVVAVASAPIKSFLRRSGIAFQESDAAQLGPLQPHAPRATTLSVGIICD